MLAEIKLNQLKTNFWRDAIRKKREPEIKYENNVDTLFHYFANPGNGPIVTHYLDQNVALLFKVDDNEIVGFSIEGLERSFASKYNASNLWRMSATGARLKGVKDMTFCVVKEEETKTSFPIRVDKGIQLKPEFAFA